ncbi:Hypothetical protein Tpal_248 [Trichococcus palustris]|jgi:predicted hydrocarbon binding protein|uniref:Uncharacterized protein n=1 Tax=Trichococcus palustris TaxID=140314 RepID=A0A143Y732_9LACT|nr:hypothetical protein [Trichococcus palustris]CZQ81839.1 Hypothetical protein Tpal_248 [Trichococcus palustris]SFK61614.1 hypothetical protein SAMN04488076_10242 [Trichococcus palustris]
MDLKDFERKFEEIKKNYAEPKRTNELTNLLEEMEREYGSVKNWGNEEDTPYLETPQMILYRNISMAREL